MVFRPSTWPIWLGSAGAFAAISVMFGADVRAIADSESVALSPALQEGVQAGLRLAFLLISVAALWLLPLLSAWWRWAVGAALAILALGVAGEIAVAAGAGWMTDATASLGAADSLDRRLFRLGSMAAFAVPMLVLLAASESKTHGNVQERSLPARVAALLVRYEPVLFAIGVATLVSCLLAASLVSTAIAWLTPIGADTTIAACAAAAIRARWRGDDLALSGWLLVCASMTVGLLMGIYAFGGPAPPPGFIGDYNALPRMLLRDAHVIVMVIGMMGIAVATTRASHRGAG